MLCARAVGVRARRSLEEAALDRIRKNTSSQRDEDRDALHILPLSIVPLESRTLSRSRLIKNARLESVVELFSNESTGSGQITPEQIGKLFSWENPEEHQDFRTIKQLSLLPSYDVYSLRIALRNLGLNVDEISELRLSEAKAMELASYMRAFTRPLLQAVFGQGDGALNTDILELFRNPDVAEVRDKLHSLADRLGVAIEEVPDFLQNYGDVYLSVAYYKYCLDQIVPELRSLLDSINDIRSHQRLSADPQLMETCGVVESRLRTATVQIARMLDNFSKSTNDMWQNVSALRFRRMEQLIMNYNTSLGSALCGINVKLSNWHQAFPSETIGGPVQRAKFLMSEVRPGLELIKELEDVTAPRFALM